MSDTIGNVEQTDTGHASGNARYQERSTMLHRESSGHANRHGLFVGRGDFLGLAGMGLERDRDLSNRVGIHLTIIRFWLGGRAAEVVSTLWRPAFFTASVVSIFVAT